MKVSDVMLPVGQVKTQTDRLRAVPVEKTADLGHSLAAVVHSQPGQDASSSSSTNLSWLLGAPAVGFVFMYVCQHGLVCARILADSCLQPCA